MTKNLTASNPSVSGKVNGQPTTVDNRNALPANFETDGLNVKISGQYNVVRLLRN